MSKFLDLEGLGYYTQCFKPGLAEVIDSGAKNLWDFKNLTSVASGGITTSKTDTDITVTSTAAWSSIAYPVTLPAGNYVFSTLISNYSKDANVPSDSNVIRIRIATQSGGQGGIGDISITENGKYSLNFTSTGATLYVLYYPNYNATSYNNTFKASENMICTKATWNISQTYQPYAMSNMEITSKIEHIANGYKLDNGSSNVITKTFNLSDIENGIYLVLVTNALSDTDKYGVSLYCLRKYATEIKLFTAIKEVQTATITSITVSGDIVTITYGNTGYHTCIFITAT